MTHRWQDWFNVVASAWLLLSAWLFNFSGDITAQWTLIVVGALIGVLALFNWERLSATATEWLVALLGAVTFATP